MPNHTSVHHVAVSQSSASVRCRADSFCGASSIAPASTHVSADAARPHAATSEPSRTSPAHASSSTTALTTSPAIARRASAAASLAAAAADAAGRKASPSSSRLHRSAAQLPNQPFEVISNGPQNVSTPAAAAHQAEKKPANTACAVTLPLTAAPSANASGLKCAMSSSSATATSDTSDAARPYDPRRLQS